MSAMAIDRSLDDIIAAKPKNFRRGTRKGPRAAALGSHASGTPNAAAARARYSGATPAANNATQPTPGNGPSATKIIVSNLPADVNETQIRDLFSTTVGPLKDVTLNFDHSGRSKGVATVVFVRRGDGTKAFNQYNNRLIDGKRPMKVEMIMDPPAAPTLSQRVAPATQAASTSTSAPAAGARRSTRPGRGRGAGRRKGDVRPKKTAEDLDAEMEDYSSNTQPTAAAA
jgi:THO complex subunit 4